MQQKLVQIFFTTRSCRSNIEKEPKKPRPKLKNKYYIFTENICSAYSPMQVVVFCKRINFVEQGNLK